ERILFRAAGVTYSPLPGPMPATIILFSMINSPTNFFHAPKNFPSHAIFLLNVQGKCNKGKNLRGVEMFNEKIFYGG
ncbi:MAG: hypothetical protein IJG32_06600, partial [Selenomonadaceae bacterium]|nr:hypothetical protein [Selenomonadaceae bacterium]